MTSSAPAPAQTEQATGRIPGLDGLRAIAIVAVLIFHLRAASLPGGYLGVDVFFVVSGFLITTLLVRERHTQGRIDLRRFWTRRARRLLPALVLVVVVATVIGLIVGQDLLVDARRQVLGAFTFSTNWLELFAGTSYFTQTAPQMFINFWSLAVEEQFYLVWPLLLGLLLRAVHSLRVRVLIVLGLAVASALAMALLASEGSTRVYYGTDTHAFGLMLGAALALWLHSRAPTVSAWIRAVMALVGLAGLLLLMALLEGESAFAYQGGILLASGATALVVAAAATAPEGDPLARILSVRPLTWVGERSYGIYLWHWPMLLIITAVLPAAVPDSAAWWWGRALAVALTLAGAACSYRWVETPIRRDGFRATLVAVRTSLQQAVPVWPRMVAAVAAVMVSAFVIALVVAPDKSQVELQFEAAASAVEPTPQGSETAQDEQTVAPGALMDKLDPGVPAPMPTGDQISAFGDSLLYVAAPAMTEVFPGIAIDAESNRQWPAVTAAIEAAVAAGTVREVVVIAAGSNAGLRDPAPLLQALEALGPDRQVVLVNLYHDSYWIPESNANMELVAAENPNVVIADWNGAITVNLDQLQPDGVHPNFDGIYLFADVVSQALEP
ncbi:MAG: acyltransferase family protein [Beutenbergiaceae bacterium]